MSCTSFLQTFTAAGINTVNVETSEFYTAQKVHGSKRTGIFIARDSIGPSLPTPASVRGAAGTCSVLRVGSHRPSACDPKPLGGARPTGIQGQLGRRPLSLENEGFGAETLGRDPSLAGGFARQRVRPAAVGISRWLYPLMCCPFLGSRRGGHESAKQSPGHRPHRAAVTVYLGRFPWPLCGQPRGDGPGLQEHVSILAAGAA